MKVKTGTPNTSEAVLVGTRVSPSVKENFAELARQNNRSISGQLRAMIERELKEAA